MVMLTRAEFQRTSLELQNKISKQFSELMAALNRSRDDKLCDDRSPLDRYSPSSQKVKGSGSEGLERSLNDEELVETEVETKASGIEDRFMKPIYEIKADKEIPKASSMSKRRYKLQKKISCEEMDERMLKGLCVFCNELETLDHYLQHMNSSLLMIDSEDHLSDSMVNEIGNEISSDSWLSNSMGCELETGETDNDEDRAVENEANSKVISAIVKEESIPQFLMVTEADSTCVQHTNVILQQVSISPLEHSLNFCKANLDVMGNCQYAMGKSHHIWSDSNFGCVNDDACQVFDVIHMRTKVLPREQKKRFHKSWRFKFKDKVQPSKLIQEQLGVHEGNATRNQLRSPSGFVVDDLHSGFGSDIWCVQYLVGSVVVEDFQETQWLFNDELKDNQIFQILIEEGSNSSAYQKFNGMRIGGHRLHHQKKLSKSPKSWKFKFKISLEDTDFVFKMDRWLKAPYVKLETKSFLEIESMQEDVQLVLLAFLHVNATEPRYAIGERDEMLEVARDVSKRSMLGLTFGIRESNAGEDQRAVCEQIIKVNVWLYQISLVLQQVMRSKKIKFPKRWMFKYKYGKAGIQRLQIQLRYKSWLEFEERFKSWRRHLHLHLDCEEPELAGQKRNHGLFIRLHCKQKQRKCPKSWMFKFKTGSKLAGTSHLKRHKESGLCAQIRGVRKKSKLLLLSLCLSFLCRAMLRFFLLYKTLRSRFL